MVFMARPRGHRLSPTAWDDVLRLTGANLTTIAERAEIPRATVSGILGGHARASVPVAHKIASAAGVHPQTLFPTLAAGISEAAAA